MPSARPLESRVLKWAPLLLSGLIAIPGSRAAEANLAHGKPYTLDPPPDYSHCTDLDDTRQLTDGQYSEGYFWTQRSTVGWSGAQPIIITLDLGRVQPIRGLSFSTAAGVAGVEWPRDITILVSDDGSRFQVAGELVELGARHRLPPREGYALHRFVTAELRTHGRYVKLLIAPSGPYCFVDEIEIFPGDSQWVQEPFEGETITDARAFFRRNALRKAIQRRIREDARAVQDVARRADVPAETRRRLCENLDEVVRDLPCLPHELPDSFRAVLPLNTLHARVFQAQADLWRALGATPLTVWASGLWDPLSLIGLPPFGSADETGGEPVRAEVRVAMMQNEYRAGAFNLSVAAEHPLTVRVRITGLPGGLDPSYITVHELAWTDTKNGQPVAAALPPARQADGSFMLDVPPGLPRQVWLTFHPVDVPPGVHQGSIVLSAEGLSWIVPLVLHLYPLRFPDIPTLHVGGWDYTDAEARYEITPQNRDAVIAHLREHFVDSPWATAAVLGRGRYDAGGRLTAPPETDHFDRWRQRWLGARQYCIFVAVEDHFDGAPLDTSLFKKKVGEWTAFWAGHVRKCGLKPQQLALLLVDEPREPQQDAVILAWTRAIRAANTGIRVWEDPCHPDPAQANQDMMRACHILCPNRPTFLHASPSCRDYYARRRSEGIELAFYSCSGPVRLLDPYTYHRLQPWTCWQYGAASSYFWAFGDSGGASSWNEYVAPRAAYVPFFLDATSVTPAKHMEALREGVEDFEYLVMLRDRLAQATLRHVPDPVRDRARRLLADVPKRVCQAQGASAFTWAQEKDRSLADKVRIEILDALTELR